MWVGDDDKISMHLDQNNKMTERALVEGEDYYLEGSALVFTAAYHQRRGYCCGNGCRHCPYQQTDIAPPSHPCGAL